jgi:hypothetical protein
MIKPSLTVCMQLPIHTARNGADMFARGRHERSALDAEYRRLDLLVLEPMNG